MTLLHEILRYTHIAMGAVGLLSGVGAMALRKGSTAHARVGRVFFVSMTLMALCGTILSIVPKLDRLNITAGTLTVYLVLTAWLTARREPGRVGRPERAAALFGAAGATGIFAFATAAAGRPGQAGAVPFYVAFGSVMALAVVGDIRHLLVGGLRGRARTTRHLWRMCTAMLLATLSLFLGQPQVFPAAIRERGLLPIPPALVALALLYFVLKEQLWPRLAKRRAAALSPR